MKQFFNNNFLFLWRTLPHPTYYLLNGAKSIMFNVSPKTKKWNTANFLLCLSYKPYNNFTPIMIVLKFGGTSVLDADRIKHVATILKSYHQKKIKIATVFSAFGGVTDQLIEASRMAAFNFCKMLI